MSPTPDTLSQNLRYLCADRPSVASVCRDIGMNHQQFSKYLSGNTRPSPNNLRRIARYFGVTEAQLLGPASELELRAQRTSRTESERRRDPLIDVFPGDLGRMRPILGAYHVYFRAPFDPTKVVVNAAFLDERNGVVYSRIIEALRLPHIGSRRWTRCDGKATHQAGQIFVIDCERGSEPVPGFYALTVPHRQKSRYLFGTMSFLASLPRRIPASSPVVWKRIDTFRSVREVFEGCGVIAGTGQRVDSTIRDFLFGPTSGDKCLPETGEN